MATPLSQDDAGPLPKPLTLPRPLARDLRQSTVALVCFALVAMLCGASGLQNWADRGDVEGWRGALAGPLGAAANLLGPLHLSEPHQWLTGATAGWIARFAAECDATGSHFAALTEAANQVGSDSPAPAGAAPLSHPSPPSPNSAAAGAAEPGQGASSGKETARGEPVAPAAAADALEGATADSHGPAAILLAGDSLMAVGLAPGLMQASSGSKDFRLVRGYRSATGLSRPDYFDWPKALDRLLAKHQPQCVIVAMGGNDAQGFRHEKKVLHFGTPAWDDAYRGRVEELLGVGLRHDASVLWLSAPKMRSSAFSISMARLNRLAQEAAAKVKGTTYLDINPFITDTKGEFAAYLTDDKGRSQRLRTEDGVHLTDGAGRRVAPAVERWIRGHCLKKS